MPTATTVPAEDAASAEGVSQEEAAAQEPDAPTVAWSARLRALVTMLGSRIRPGGGAVSPTEAQEEDVSAEPEDATEAETEPFSNARDFNPLPAQVDPRSMSSEDIFIDIGRRLRARREMLSLTYEEIERHTKVRTAFLTALEEGALTALPSPVQTRGILANYAAFLDLDVDATLLRFAEGLQARHREQAAQRPKRRRAPMTVHTNLPPLRGFIASDLLFGGGVAIMLLLFAIWGISRVMAVRSSTISAATAPSISDVLAGTMLPTLAQQVTLIPAQDTANAPAGVSTATADLSTLAPNVNVQIKLSATGRTYMRIYVDGKQVFEGRSEPGQDYAYDASRRIEVLVGDASALKVTFNGRDLGLMGTFGQVVDLVYSTEGAATPTGTALPTRTPTPNITATPSPTPTETPSRTPTPKPGG